MTGGVYTGPGSIPHITLDQVRSDQAHTPENTTPYTVKPGDNLSTIAEQHGYGNPPDMDAFYAKNPEFQQRDHNLIYPGEVVYVKAPENGTAPTGKESPGGTAEYQNYKDGKPDGAPYESKPGSNGRPTNQDVVNGKGETIYNGPDGKPLTGPRNTGSAKDGNDNYQDYKDGKPVGKSYESKPDAQGNPTTDATGKPSPYANAGNPNSQPLPKPDAAATQANAKSYASAANEYHKTGAAPDGQARNQNHDQFVASAQAEIANGKSPEDVIKELGGDKADKYVVAAVREAATNEAAKRLRAAQAEYDQNPSSTSAAHSLTAEKKNFDAAVKNEIQVSRFIYEPAKANVQQQSKAAGDAAYNISARLETIGIKPDTKAIDTVLKQVQTKITG